MALLLVHFWSRKKIPKSKVSCFMLSNSGNTLWKNCTGVNFRMPFANSSHTETILSRPCIGCLFA
jgi:hypothetical protein